MNLRVLRKWISLPWNRIGRNSQVETWNKGEFLAATFFTFDKKTKYGTFSSPSSEARSDTPLIWLFVYVFPPISLSF
jgi:hypothetical protein